MHRPTLRYHEFEQRCRHEWRHCHDDAVHAFLDGLVTSAAQHEWVVQPTDVLWRAQLGCDEERTPSLDEEGGTLDVAVAFDASRMMPSPGHSSDGRVSPRGIATLYTATDEATAVSEVRPHVGAAVTVSQMQPTRNLRVVDCHSRHGESAFFGISGRDPMAEAWVALNRAFARPLYDLARTDLYAPTQIVSEWFRRAGFDGVAFKSSLGPGKNVAVFDPTTAKPITGQVVDVRSITVHYESTCLQRGWRLACEEP